MLVRILYKGTHNDPKMLNFPKLIFKIHKYTHKHKIYTSKNQPCQAANGKFFI